MFMIFRVRGNVKDILKHHSWLRNHDISQIESGTDENYNLLQFLSFDLIIQIRKYAKEMCRISGRCRSHQFLETLNMKSIYNEFCNYFKCFLGAYVNRVGVGMLGGAGDHLT